MVRLTVFGSVIILMFSSLIPVYAQTSQAQCNSAVSNVWLAVGILSFFPFAAIFDILGKRDIRNLIRIPLSIIATSIILLAALPFVAQAANNVNCSGLSAIVNPVFGNLAAAKGVNFGDCILMDRQTGGCPLPVAPPALSIRMADISAKGFNILRVPFHWEAYVKNKPAFIAEAQQVASTAQVYNLAVIFDNHQWNTGSGYTNLNGMRGNTGGGFPQNVTTGFATQQAFWNAYFNNTITFNGRTVWREQANMLGNLTVAVNGYSSVLGYEILNEPYVWDYSQYQKDGNMGTSVGGYMRALTTKTIFFDKVELPGGLTPYVNPPFDTLTRPSGIVNVVFGPHQYNTTNAQPLLTSYQSLAATWGVSLLIGEWGVTNQAATTNYVTVYRSNSVGWIRWSYDPFDSTYNLEDTSYNPTIRMTWLLAVM